MTQLCVAMTPKTTSEAVAQMARLGTDADLLELRVDAMDECDLQRVLSARTVPLIVTNRAANEGGFRKQDEAKRLEVLVEAARLGADYVDVELAALDRFLQLAEGVGRPRTKLIVSYHDFERMPDDLVNVARRIDATAAADVVKVVGTARSPEDNLPCFEALRSVSKPAIALAMGEAGQISRVLAGKFGAWLTFASEDAGAESAPGQITLTEMRQLYRADRVGPQTPVYAVMGNPVGHSLSPAIHNAAFQELGLDAVYVRLKVEGDPAAVVRALEAVPLEGYSVTIPHKQAVMAACVDIAPTARRMGAVNTLIRRKDGYHATNTDVTSAMKVLAQAIGSDRFTGKRALVVGAGGVGRAYVYGLLSRGAEVFVSDIDEPRRNELAQEAGAAAVAPEDLADVRADILMNGSPVGMWPKVDATPVDTAILRDGMVVFDAVYNPQETRLLREAKAAGCVTISGVEQFVGQAVEQFELWTQRKAPADLMRQVVLDALRSH
ncbi:MAG: type I 3-dehydroquinate dehydratase [Planctomycetes bacterium]|nr:type I 3-dehydroquinate dehydratase [Planctomycetota bacterium]